MRLGDRLMKDIGRRSFLERAGQLAVGSLTAAAYHPNVASAQR